MTYEVISPPDASESEWLDARRGYLGASEIGTSLGLDPWCSPYGLWLEKTGRAAPRDETEQMGMGKRLEPVVAALFAEHHDELYVAPAPGLIRGKSEVLAATPDRLVGPFADPHIPPAPLELKAPGLRAAGEWKGDEAPARYLLQLAQQVFILNCAGGWLAALIGGQTYVERWVPRDDELVALVVDQGERWWHDHVIADVPPPVDGDKRTAKLLEAIYATSSGEVVELSTAWRDKLAERQTLCDSIDILEATRDRIDNELRDAIGEGCEAFIGDTKVATWKPHNRSSIDTTALKAAEPAVAAQYTKTTTVRPLRVL